MKDDNRSLLLRVGQAQIDAMFERQEEAPVDDSEFLPLVEVVVTAFEKADDDGSIVEELWNYAYSVYDRTCKTAEPESTTEENRELMRSYLLGERRL